MDTETEYTTLRRDVTILVAGHKSLNTMETAAEWRVMCDALLRRGELLARALNAEADDKREVVARTKHESRTQAWWRWLWPTAEHRTARRSLNATKQRAKTIGPALKPLADLRTALPTTEDERTELIATLRLRIRELELQKREKTADMREVRRNARDRSSSVRAGGDTSRSEAARERRSLASQRDSELTSLERKKEKIEQQIIALERRVIWLTRF